MTASRLGQCLGNIKNKMLRGDKNTASEVKNSEAALFSALHYGKYILVFIGVTNNLLLLCDFIYSLYLISQCRLPIKIKAIRCLKHFLRKPFYGFCRTALYKLNGIRKAFFVILLRDFPCTGSAAA